MADIFVSYTSSDRAWAFWIGKELQKLGHTPHIHEWEIPAGGNIAAWMQSSHDKADHILCVLSGVYLTKDYSSWEMQAAQWAAASKRPNFALPVFVENCEAPTLLAPFKRCDLYGLEEDGARAALAAYLKDPAPPVVAPFPVTSKTAEAAPRAPDAAPFPGKPPEAGPRPEPVSASPLPVPTQSSISPSPLPPDPDMIEDRSSRERASDMTAHGKGAGRGPTSRKGMLVSLGVVALAVVVAGGVFFRLQFPPNAPPPPVAGLPTETPAPEVLLAPLETRIPGVLSPAEENALQPNSVFRECLDCPEMVVVPPGSFKMGSPDDAPDHQSDEHPQHLVTIANAFAIGRAPVTRDEFNAFVTDTPDYSVAQNCQAWNGQKFDDPQKGRSWLSPGFNQEGNHPAVCLSWYDATRYVKWLSAKTGKDYRLLSEAEWEYAARAERQPTVIYKPYSFGVSADQFCDYGNGRDQTTRKEVARAKDWPLGLPCNDYFAYTAPVQAKMRNGFGLFDMGGNVWQWVTDCYHPGYNGAPTDGTPWTNGSCDRVLRSGSWLHGAKNLRAAFRGHSPPSLQGDVVGFRVARVLKR